MGGSSSSYIDSRNLIKNPSGERGFAGWTVSKEGGNGWDIESEPIFCGPVPRNEFLGVTSSPFATCCFTTSYEWCAKSYLVDLADVISLLGNSSFEIKCGQMYMARGDCGGEFRWRLSLLDSSKDVLLRKYEAEYELEAQPDGDLSIWERAEHTFKFEPEDKDIVEQIHYLEFFHEGKDKNHWDGHYGMKFARSTVVIVEDQSFSCTNSCLEHDPNWETISTSNISENREPREVENSETSLHDNPCFRCPICLEIPRKKKIFQCTNGHTVCETCVRQIESCPQCRVALSRENGIRNRALEDAIKTLF